MLKISDISKLEIPIIRDVDVLVVGGGTAGAVAAIAAARSGAKTLVVDQFGFLGGTQTAALVTPVMPNMIGKKSLNGGLDEEITSKLADMNESAEFSDGNKGWFNPEALKSLLQKMCIDAKAEILYFSQFEDAIVDKKKIRGVTVLNKSGRCAIFAKRIIDATGDADVAIRAGVPCSSGDSNGANQPFSVRFNIGNVDMKKFIAFLLSLGEKDILEKTDKRSFPLVHTAMVWGGDWKLEPVFRKAVDEGVLKESDGNYFQAFSVPGRPGELSLNCPRISTDTDATNPFHLTQAMIKGRVVIDRYIDFFRRYFPGCENCYVSTVAQMVGVRDSRRICGEYELVEDDLRKGRKFEDGVARNCYPLDIHSDKESEDVGLSELPEGEFHEIPYRSLVPQKIENLLVAGRCISATFKAQSSIRIITNCRAMGEAAGVAAALSIKEKVSPRKLDGRIVRKKLIENGAHL